MKENLSDHGIVWEIIFCETSIKLYNVRTILWTIKFSVIVHLRVENPFSWWNSLFVFFTEALSILIYLSYSLWIIDEGYYCCKIRTNFPLGTWNVLSSIEIFYSGSKSISSVLLTCLLHGLPKTLLAQKLLESNCF